MAIQEVSGFQYKGHVFSTLSAAQHAEKVDIARVVLDGATDRLGCEMKALYESNQGYDPFKGMAGDLFGFDGKESNFDFMEAFEYARNAAQELRDILK